MTFYFFFFLILRLSLTVRAVPPNIIFMLVDDQGFNDISLHGSQQIPTPNIDAIAAAGVSFDRYYTNPVCSPTRASLMTGRATIHHGIYLPMNPGINGGHLNLSFTLLPAYLKRAANYTTAAVGKWHLGSTTVSASPVGRGFDSYTGYWCGALDYTSHEVAGPNGTILYDFHNTTATTDEPLVGAYGTFSTNVFVDTATAIIAKQGAAQKLSPDSPPLFLYLAWQNVHWPLEAPQEYVARFANTTGGDHNRNYVAAMNAFLDDAVGNVTCAISAAGMVDNTIIILVSDNGGPRFPTGSEPGAASNFPLRGGKDTLWEGGVRVNGMMRGPGIAAGMTSSAYVHVTDWLPSLVSMATGGEDYRNFSSPGEPPFQAGDGLDVWTSIASGGVTPSPRNWLLLEAHPDLSSVHGNGLIIDDLKLLTYGSEENGNVEDGWFVPPGQNASTIDYSVKCTSAGFPRTGAANASQCKAPSWCLFNITADPCEYYDLSLSQPIDLANMIAAIAKYQATAVPPNYGSACMPSLTCEDAPLAPRGQLTAVWPCDGMRGNITKPCPKYEGQATFLVLDE